jgi:hypothetical protein
MKSTRLTLLATLLLSLIASVSSLAQETEEDTAPVAPNFAEIQQNWWSYFEGTQSEIEPRIAEFFVKLDEEIPLLGAQNQETAQSVLEAVQDNLDVYPRSPQSPAARTQPLLRRSRKSSVNNASSMVPVDAATPCSRIIWMQTTAMSAG